VGDRIADIKAPPEDRVWLPKQSIDAEEQKKVHYLISLSWCYNEIEYGLLKGGWKSG
jgi:hypothetical protein